MRRVSAVVLGVIGLSLPGLLMGQEASPATAPTAEVPIVPAATRPATVPAEPPVSPAVAKLIADLSATDWHARKKAEAALVDLGDESVRALEQASRAASLDEARTAATRALKQIDENRRVGQSLITLRLKDVPVRQAFEALGRQARAELKPFPDSLWQDQFASAKVSIDVERQPFWTVLRTLSKETGVDVGSVNGEPRWVASDGQTAAARAVVTGPFLVMASQIHRSQSVDLTQPQVQLEDDFGIHFGVMAEPKLRVLSALTVAKLDEVVDDAGNSLLPDKQQEFDEEELFNPNIGHESVYPMTAWLKYPAKNPGRVIARLRGTARFTVQVESEKLDLPVKKVRGTVRSYQSVPLTFGELQKANDVWQLKVHSSVNEEHPAWEELQNSLMQQLKVVDSRGQPLDHHGYNSNSGQNGMEITLTFGPSHRPEDGRQSGDPARIVWEIPTRTRTLTVPFEFKDLKMP